MNKERTADLSVIWVVMLSIIAGLMLLVCSCADQQAVMKIRPKPDMPVITFTDVCGVEIQADGSIRITMVDGTVVTYQSVPLEAH